MNFASTEEQELIAAALARFVERDYAFDQRQAIVSSADGYSAAVWRTMADLGLLGLALPTDCGGLGGGAVESMSLMDAIGSALIVEPWLACTGVAAQLVARGGTNAQRRRILPSVVDGTLKLAFAHLEADAAQCVTPVKMHAQRVEGGYAISGVKRAVPYGAASDLLVVSACRNETGALGLLLVPATAPGVAFRAVRMLDGTRAADVSFDRVRVPGDAWLDAASDAPSVIDEVTDFATALLCAEAVGAIRSANDDTLEYLKTRRQFGVPIGSFQALQHRMVDLVIEYEQAKSMAALACSAVDGERGVRTRARKVSAAKVRVSEACRRVSQESVQLHGGMGMSDELKISHTFRRLTAIAQQFGGVDHHLERFSELSRTNAT